MRLPEKRQKAALPPEAMKTHRSSRGKVTPDKLKLYGTIAIILLVVIVILVAITRIVAFFLPLIIVVFLATYIIKHWGDRR